MAQQTITSDDILGKDIIDTDGEILGVVQQLRIDKRSKVMLGVLVDQGFMRPDLFVGLDFIRNFGVDSIFLTQSPKSKIKGIDVYDKKGKLLGFVHAVEDDVKQDIVHAVIIKKHHLAKAYRIDKKYIRTIAFSVMLKVTEAELVKEEVPHSGWFG